MPESSPSPDQFDQQFAPILDPQLSAPSRLERFKCKIDPSDLRDLTALLAGAALFMSGSLAKHLAVNLEGKISTERVECYAGKDSSQYSGECTDSTLGAFDLGAKIFTVLGFSGGTIMTANLLTSQLKRRNGA